jgi:hypothetical protein
MDQDTRLILETLMAIASTLEAIPPERQMVPAYCRTLLAGRAAAIDNRLRATPFNTPPRTEAAAIAAQDAQTITRIREWSDAHPAHKSVGMDAVNDLLRMVHELNRKPFDDFASSPVGAAINAPKPIHECPTCGATSDREFARGHAALCTRPECRL